MKANMRCAIAALNIFLLLSVGPIDATRVAGLREKVDKVHQMRVELMEEMDDIKTGSENASFMELSSGTHADQCRALLDRFDSVSQKLEKSVSNRDINKMRAIDSASTAVRVYRMARLMSAAQKKGCDWSSNRESPSQMLDPLTRAAKQAGVNSNPCALKANDILISAQNVTDAQKQAELVGESIATLLSADPQCAAPSLAEAARDVDAADESATEDTDAMLIDVDGLAEALTDSAVQGTLSADGPASLIQLLRPNTVGTGVSPDAPAVKSPDDGEGWGKNHGQTWGYARSGFIVVIVLTFAMFFFSAMVECWLRAAITILLLGMLVCLLKLVFKLITRKSGEKLKFGKCAAWWLNAIGLDGFKNPQAPMMVVAGCALAWPISNYGSEQWLFPGFTGGFGGR